ncbi:MAG TPA: SDR family NAD(P)-dependent oxidoreductase [Solirubrobacteraceae bacterium]|nr:SDR family NAD(P)-dependent oxidoreductase [Solirubrobacteraceae bacterium]
MPDPRLLGKVALVTGAAGGIGTATAERFAHEGASVMVTDADGERAEELARRLGEGASGRAQDVTSEDAWSQTVAWVLEHHGHIDVLVNNAGVFLAEPLATTSLAKFNKVLDVNVVGVFLGMREVAAHMSARGSGSIINVSSLAGLTGGPLLTAYAASKWAVRGMTKVAARELARAGVRVNSVHPGQIDTDMNTRQREATPELIERLIRTIPLGRIGTPEEVAHALVYLASDESVYTTGSELVVDGGSNA